MFSPRVGVLLYDSYTKKFLKSSRLVNYNYYDTQPNIALSLEYLNYIIRCGGYLQVTCVIHSGNTEYCIG